MNIFQPSYTNQEQSLLDLFAWQKSMHVEHHDWLHMHVKQDFTNKEVIVNIKHNYIHDETETVVWFTREDHQFMCHA